MQKEFPFKEQSCETALLKINVPVGFELTPSLPSIHLMVGIIERLQIASSHAPLYWMNQGQNMKNTTKLRLIVSVQNFKTFRIPGYQDFSLEHQ